ncbi:beta-galactosidase precursor [Bombardia bombarda]|uniref:Beta-galactosidase n=1 Tax=Bombardia bombarda TaxID=252184 RepID=A0AA39TMV5_9PEZI|nr:beta-galactosidase precursor [Bombardia bombarda]
MRLLSALSVISLALSQGCGAALRGRRAGGGIRGAGRPDLLLRDSSVHNSHDARGLLQDIVTWDNHSLMINGERLMIFSGEFHPFRLPVPSLWLDVFQKIKALGLNTVSFYVDWALLEGKPGEFTAEGVFNYETFFDAAKEAGIYLIARPGPYINAEASAGGYPGWLQRVKGRLRTSDADYLAATDNYVANIGAIIAKAQITNGGPVILWQPENEYSVGADGIEFPNPEYMQYAEDQARKAGIVVPFINNDVYPGGHNAPGTGEGEVDIYGHDGYPLGFDCGQPTVWPADALPTTYHAMHEAISPSTPFAIPEGGSYDPWGGLGYDQCYELLSQEQVRVFYKNNYAAGIAIMSIYMIFGGTNWGNLGHPGCYTSYDYAAVIAEDRTVAREKYSELKLEANFLKASPGYLTATPSTGVYSSTEAITVTPVLGTSGSFFVVRHTDYQLTDSTPYTLTLPTSKGNLTIPQLGGSLTLTRRDSKIHVTDYPVGDKTIIYSTAEIFTWQKFGDRTVVVVYGGPGELHEIAIDGNTPWKVTGAGVNVKNDNNTFTVGQWKSSTQRRIIKVGELHVYVVDRNSAYNYWAPEIDSQSSLIVNGGYLIRSASVNNNALFIRADFNTTTTIELIGVPSSATSLYINDSPAQHTISADGNWVADAGYSSPQVSLPDLSALQWHQIDSLPEIQPGYDDSAWPNADHTTTNNTNVQPFLTPVSLYGSDYGFHTGVLLFRGHFVATGSESQLYLLTQGGSAYASSVWLNSTFLGSWSGNDATSVHGDTYTLPPSLTPGAAYVLTILVDNMGLNENGVVGSDESKLPRGILDYALITASTSTNPSTYSNTATTPPLITWKITGNFGGESYADHARGPLNEGGLYIERQGFHQPNPPLARFSQNSSSPFADIPAPGAAFYTAKLTLSIPADEYDIPLSVVFSNDTTAAATTSPYRAWLYVNGFQFGRYISDVGPQREFPVPEGVWNYDGENWVGLAVWATREGGARVPRLELRAKTAVMTGRAGRATLVGGTGWTVREGAY